MLFIFNFELLASEKATTEARELSEPSIFAFIALLSPTVVLYLPKVDSTG